MRPFTPMTRGLPSSSRRDLSRTSISDSVSLGPEELIRTLTGSPASISSVFGLSLSKPGKSQLRSVIVGDEGASPSTPAQGLPSACAIREPISVLNLVRQSYRVLPEAGDIHQEGISQSKTPIAR